MLAKLVGISTDTLRLYERKGLLRSPMRTDNGYRCYSPDCIVRLRLIRAALSIGFTLDELAKILKIRDAGGAPCTRSATWPSRSWRDSSSTSGNWHCCATSFATCSRGGIVCLKKFRNTSQPACWRCWPLRPQSPVSCPLTFTPQSPGRLDDDSENSLHHIVIGSGVHLFLSQPRRAIGSAPRKVHSTIFPARSFSFWPRIHDESG